MAEVTVPGSLDAIVTGLRRWTESHDPHVRAAVELIIWQDHWLRRGDFRKACVIVDPRDVWINWGNAREFADSRPRGSTSDLVILDLAVALGENRYRLPVMGSKHARAVTEAVADAAGVDIVRPAEPRLAEPERWLAEDARVVLARFGAVETMPHASFERILAERLRDVLAILDRVAPQGGDRGE